MLLRTLGELSLEGSDFSRPKPLLLLAYLALEGPKPRRYLAELFFMDTKDPFNGLSQALKLLRKNVPGAVEADTQKAWTTLECDAAKLLNLADKRQFSECTKLYQGAFAETLNLSLDSELEEWVYGTREYLAGRTREAFLQTADREALKGDFTRAASYAEAAYTLTGAPELEPEHFVRLYTLLLADNNPRAAEVRAEAESYGIPLNLSVGEAKSRFVPDEAGTEVPNNLPPPKTSFVGRDQELHEISDLLRNPDCRLLTLHGMGGVGKSRLAVQAARDQLTQGWFKDGIHFVSLDALSSADLVPSTIAEHIGLNFQGQEDILTQVERHIGKKRVLLVLDNYEHLMDAALLPSALLEACPNLKLMVTSREVLRLEEEWVKLLDGLRYPEISDVGLEEAQAYDAVNLFIQRAKRTKLDYTPTEADLPHILKLCKLTEGSPLALELAATWVRVMSTESITQEINVNASNIQGLKRNLPEKHQTIYSLFESSWKLLKTTEKVVLRQTSMFAGDFSRDAAQKITGATLMVLASLVDKSLLRVDSEGRFTSHPLVQQCAHARLTDVPAEETQTLERYQYYFYEFVQERYSQPDKFREIEQELANILLAIETARRNDQRTYFVEMMKWMVVGQSYYAARGFHPTLFQHLQAASEAAQSLSELRTTHHLLARLGDTYRESFGDSDKAATAYGEALKLAREIGDNNREILMLSLLGVVSFHQDTRTSEKFLKEAYALAERCGDRVVFSQVLQHSGYVAALRENLLGARDLFRESVDLLNRFGGLEKEYYPPVAHRLFFSLLNLSEAEHHLGNFEDALETCHQAKQLAAQKDNRVWLAYALQNMGGIYHSMQNRQSAQSCLREALKLYEKCSVFAEYDELWTFMQNEAYLSLAEKDATNGAKEAARA